MNKLSITRLDTIEYIVNEDDVDEDDATLTIGDGFL